MTDITKLELVQHSMNSIKYYLDDLLKIQHQIDDLKERSKELAFRAKELAFRAKDESRIISIYLNDEAFKQSLCDDFLQKVKHLQDRVNNLNSVKNDY